MTATATYTKNLTVPRQDTTHALDQIKGGRTRPKRHGKAGSAWWWWCCKNGRGSSTRDRSNTLDQGVRLARKGLLRRPSDCEHVIRRRLIDNALLECRPMGGSHG